MPVLITTKQLPERCRDCFAFSGKLRYGCTLGAGQGSEPAVVYRGRHADCPLQAFPETHGPLIDKEKLVVDLDQSCKRNTHRSEEAKKLHRQEHWHLLQIIMRQPVIVGRKDEEVEP